MASSGLEEAFKKIVEIRFIGDFYAYQIISDMVEIGLLKFRRENSMLLLLIFNTQ